MAQMSTFNPEELPPDEYELLPVGEYPMEVSDSDAIRKDNGVELVKLTFTIIDGQMRGRKVFGNYCNRHPTSAQAQNIAQRFLSNLTRAVGLSAVPGDTTAFHHRPFIGAVRHTKPSEDGRYGANNEIGKVRPFENPGPQSRPAPQQNRQQTYQPPQNQQHTQAYQQHQNNQQAGANGGRMPWDR